MSSATISSPAIIPLSLLPAGQSALVCDIVGQSDLIHRLREFGFSDGAEIQMFQPGDPFIVRLAGNKVCVRADDRINVLVKPLDSPC